MTFTRIALALGLAALASHAAAQQRQTYIVQLADAPVAAYNGGIAGLPATQPARGAKLNVNASNVRAYINYLESKRTNAAATVNAAAIVHRYNIAFNGFSAKLTADEARKLARTAGVVAVTPDEARAVDTTRTPAFLGLSGPGGLWSALDSQSRNVKGENVIIGIVDGGIWPENPSFSDKVDALGKPVPYFQAGTQVYGPPPAKWAGSCQAGQGFTTAMCNNKLIGAQFFNAGFNAFGRPMWPTDYVGPRDEDGHGSHTASTAGGNEGAEASIGGLPAGIMSGVAPRARIAAYRVCWSYVEDGTGARKNSCFTSDSVAAIDKAVADGVDVINYSISGTRTNYLDPVEVAFFNASAAGVFVAASAGNSGPANTVAHMSPWLTTVAASTHDRFTVATVTLGNGATASGPSFQSTGLSATPLIASTDAGLPGADAASLARCLGAADGIAAQLDPAKVAGKIVVCYRGANVLVNKAANAKAAGAAGMIIQNIPSGPLASADSVFNIAYELPTVHLAGVHANAVLSHAATPGASAAFSPGVQVAGVVAPVMGDFSSRGPSLADKNILKPDISAPGVDIIAAYVAENSDQVAVRDAIIAGTTANPGSASLQGTSMSSPHVAGAAALMKQLYPTWSPAAIKSALMTSANDIKLGNGSADLNRWGYGAGHLNPTPAANPGLVYDAGPVDYLRFLCGIGSLPASHGACVAYGTITPWNLNLASLTAADVLGKITIKRTVKNVGSSTATFNASTSLPGWDVTVVPSSLTLAPGASGSFDVNLARSSAAVNTWTFGHLTWSDGVRQVRSPLSVRGALFSGPTEVSDNRARGTKVFTVGLGYAGKLAVSPTGMVAATRHTGQVATNQSQCFNVTVPAGAHIARFQLFDSDTQGGSASDLDLEVYAGPDGSGALVGASGTATSEEKVDLRAPAAGTYSACVFGYAPLNGNATFTLSNWVVGPAVGVQTLKAGVGAKAFLGGTSTTALAWNVPPGNRYLGIAQFTDGDGTALGNTLLSVDVH
ncbi:Minor extracellular protease vpr [Burkholderiaceae bacterium]|nr:Minor extracellular protease vpr [Burkholderiaceae bacterium]